MEKVGIIGSGLIGRSWVSIEIFLVEFNGRPRPWFSHRLATQSCCLTSKKSKLTLRWKICKWEWCYFGIVSFQWKSVSCLDKIWSFERKSKRQGAAFPYQRYGQTCRCLWKCRSRSRVRPRKSRSQEESFCFNSSRMQRSHSHLLIYLLLDAFSYLQWLWSDFTGLT